MEQLLNRLLMLLIDLVGLYRSLLAVYQDERQSLLAFELDGITATSKKKEILILKVKILEESSLASVTMATSPVTLEKCILSLSTCSTEYK